MNTAKPSDEGKKGTVPICRNGPKAGAMLAWSSHKWGLSPFSPDDPLRSLLDAACNDAIDDEQFEQLEAALSASEDARREYLRCFTLSGELRYLVSMAQADEAARERTGLECGVGDHFAETPSPPAFPALVPLPTHFFPPSSFVDSWTFSYLVATAIMGAMILGAWALKVTHHYNLADNSRGQTAPGESAQKRPEMVFVGRVTGMVDCKWSDPSTEPFAGAYIPLGRKYALASGLMQITYDSGAKVILQGPCAYEVESGSGGFLALGKLTAKVEQRGEGRGARGEGAANPKSQIPNQQISNPQSLIPDPLFAVRTPTAVVTDLGTEFGVAVNLEGNTVSHVFRGLVRVQVVAANGGRQEEVVLRINESARVERNRDIVRLAQLADGETSPQFVRRLSKPTIAFSGSYDGSYEPDCATPPKGQSKWIKHVGPNASITLISDNEARSPGIVDFYDRGTALGERLSINREMGSGAFSAGQAKDQYAFEARLKLSSTEVFDDPAKNVCPFGLGFRDEYNGTTNGKSVWLGWYSNAEFGPDPRGEPGLWLLNPEATGRCSFDSYSAGRVNVVNYFDDQWHTYRVEKLLIAGEAKVRVFVDGVQQGPTFDYSDLGDSPFSNCGFGLWTSSDETCRVAVDYIRYWILRNPNSPSPTPKSEDGGGAAGRRSDGSGGSPREGNGNRLIAGEKL